MRLEIRDCLVASGLDESCLTNRSVAESEEDVNEGAGWFSQ